MYHRLCVLGFLGCVLTSFVGCQCGGLGGCGGRLGGIQVCKGGCAGGCCTPTDCCSGSCCGGGECGYGDCGCGQATDCGCGSECGCDAAVGGADCGCGGGAYPAGPIPPHASGCGCAGCGKAGRLSGGFHQGCCEPETFMPLWNSIAGCTGCGTDWYWNEWYSDPPNCTDPCDQCGNWTGPPSRQVAPNPESVATLDEPAHFAVSRKRGRTLRR